MARLKRIDLGALGGARLVVVELGDSNPGSYLAKRRIHLRCGGSDPGKRLFVMR